MGTLATQQGYQQGETTTPTTPLLTYQVSSWLQIPQILKKLETHGGEGIKLDFPKDAPSSPEKAKELRQFLERSHSKSCSEMMAELADRIDSSGELAFANTQLAGGAKISSGAQWVAAFKLSKRGLNDKLKVTTIASLSVSDTGEVNRSVFVQVKDAVTQGRPVIYQLDGSQGAASALLEELDKLGTTDPRSCAIWSGSETGFPKAGGAIVRDIALGDFLRRERRKKPLLDDLQALTEPHRDVYFELKKIKTDDFDALDRTGKTVLDNLHRIHSAASLQGIENHIVPSPPTPDAVKEWRAHLAAAAIERLFHPGRANQDQHGTCAAETIIRLIGTVRPGEWSRLVADLIVDGESELSAPGAVPPLKVKPAEDWALADESRSREAFDALLQSALMGRAAQKADPNFSYSNIQDAFVGPSGNIQYETDAHGNPIQEVDHLGNPVFEPDGVTPKYTKRNGMDDDCALELISALDGAPHVCLDKIELRKQLGRSFAERLGRLAEQCGGIYVALKWGTGAHAVMLQRYDPVSDTLIFSNPQGKDPNRNNGDVIPGNAGEPQRQIVDNELGEQSMTRQLFEQLLQSAILSKG
jgi:hypothetical protein